MAVANPVRETVDALLEEGGEALNLCYQCGLCSGTCPWNLVRSFTVRGMIHQAQLGLVDFEDEDVWLCATCGACVKQCPRGVELIDIIRALRRTIVGLGVGKVPESLRITVKSISGVGNPLGEAEEKRADWAQDTGVKTFTKGTELLYFPCCLPCYDPHMIGIAQATVGILKKVGVDFGILGTSETCCGEAIRKAGNESLFQSLAQKNITTFAESGVKSVLVSSPHCYHTFKNEYPELGSNFEVIHSTQYLLGLIKDQGLGFTKELRKKVVYHDPCYLGRHNGIYDEPREILRSIPGLELVEFPDYGEDSICCGGGAGRLWMETKKGERFSDLRLEQAIELGVEVLAVACPYCMCMFKDSQLTVDKGETIEIKDISELVQEAI
ncbi:MAG: (Fe-S)-binding protein [Dehalococcoidia bacterium]|nr:MAG: (Fe-S)-binding protein [Dehalococcoidia bacterium]